MISILDRVIYGTFLSLLKLFKDSKLKENDMTAVVSRPGVNGATRYMNRLLLPRRRYHAYGRGRSQ